MERPVTEEKGRGVNNFLTLGFALIAASWVYPALASEPYQFNAEDRAFLGGLSLSNIGRPTNTAGNEVLDNEGAARFGKQLFFDARLSKNGNVSCATCHDPGKYFTDGLRHSQGIGFTKRNAPSILLSAWSPWQYWDGRKDSMWSQALGPLEADVEHGMSREGIAEIIAEHYSDSYRSVFGPSDFEVGDTTRVFVNVGKALMAYEYRLALKPAKFDRFAELIANNEDVAAKSVFNADEVAGLRLFMGKGNCISCHNGPLFTNFEFHNVGIPEDDEQQVDLGRFSGVKKLALDEFTCLSRFSSASPDECLEMKFLKVDGPELVGAFKTPSLRNVAMTAPYMHAGQFATLEAVIEHYNKPKPPFYDRKQHPNRPHFDILPLRLTEEEKAQIVAFLKTMTSPLPEEDEWWPVSASASP